MNKIQGSTDIEPSATVDGVVAQEESKEAGLFEADDTRTGASFDASARSSEQSLLSRSRSPEHNVRRSLFRQ